MGIHILVKQCLLYFYILYLGGGGRGGGAGGGGGGGGADILQKEFLIHFREWLCFDLNSNESALMGVIDGKVRTILV